MKKDVEILAPAGSFETLKVAVSNGADAVYVGGSRFGARAYAPNFNEEELLEAIDYTHLHGRKLYLTVNTLIKEDEFDDLYAYLSPYYERGLDAVIVQDMGVMQYIMKQFPGMAIHASTQMTITSYLSAKYLEDLGVERVVPARELSLAEIRKISDETGLEIECFVHGALCYCYSGQCLLSSMIGGRSGNRGQCAQPCRLPYKVQDGKKNMDIMSLKDLCTIDMIPELIEAGITSFKIEGRMKHPSYVATVTRIYRKYADLYLKKGKSAYKINENDRQELLAAYQRRGYCKGYYKQHNGKNMISFERPEFAADASQDYVVEKLQEKIDGVLTVSPGEPIKLSLSYKMNAQKQNEISVVVKGIRAEVAQKQPLTVERIDKQMRKTGNTPFVFDNLEINMEGDVFLPMQSLNEVRRVAVEKLELSILERFRRKRILKIKKNVEDKPKIVESSFTASVETLEQMKAVMKCGWVKRIYLEDAIYFSDNKVCLETCLKEARNRNIEVYFAMARIFRERAESLYEKAVSELVKLFDGVLIRNLESYLFLKNHSYERSVVLDSNLYQWNKEACSFWLKDGIERATAPLELNYRELMELGIESMELVVYGYLPVMITAGCIRKNTEGCLAQRGQMIISDRYQKQFLVKNECIYCYNVIYNTDPVMLLDQKDEIQELMPCALRLSFTSENGETVEKILKKYEDVFIWNKDAVMPEGGFTRGHFKRGVK